MVVLRSTSGLHMGEFDGAEAIAALGFDRRSQQKAVFGDVNAHIRQFLGSGFLKNGSSKFRQTAVYCHHRVRAGFQGLGFNGLSVLRDSETVRKRMLMDGMD